jgi:hypothetical protein
LAPFGEADAQENAAMAKRAAEDGHVAAKRTHTDAATPGPEFVVAAVPPRVAAALLSSALLAEDDCPADLGDVLDRLSFVLAELSLPAARALPLLEAAIASQAYFADWALTWLTPAYPAARALPWPDLVDAWRLADALSMSCGGLEFDAAQRLSWSQAADDAFRAGESRVPAAFFAAVRERCESPLADGTAAAVAAAARVKWLRTLVVENMNEGHVAPLARFLADDGTAPEDVSAALPAFFAAVARARASVRRSRTVRAVSARVAALCDGGTTAPAGVFLKQLTSSWWPAGADAVVCSAIQAHGLVERNGGASGASTASDEARARKRPTVWVWHAALDALRMQVQNDAEDKFGTRAASRARVCASMARFVVDAVRARDWSGSGEWSMPLLYARFAEWCGRDAALPPVLAAEMALALTFLLQENHRSAALTGRALRAQRLWTCVRSLFGAGEALVAEFARGDGGDVVGTYVVLAALVRADCDTEELVEVAAAVAAVETGAKAELLASLLRRRSAQRPRREWAVYPH